MHEYHECESCPLSGAEIYQLISGYDASEHFEHCASGSEKGEAGCNFWSRLHRSRDCI